MRVSTKQIYDNINNNIPKKMGEVIRIQEQLASGKKINKISDDPVLVTRTINYKNIISRADQFIRNINYGNTFLKTADGVLGDVHNSLIKAKEISLSMSNGTANAQIRNSAAGEVQGIIDQLVMIGNTKVGDRFIFSGYTTHAKYKGTDISGSIPLTISAPNDTLTLSVDGGTNTTVSLAGGPYPDGDSLAAGIQDQLDTAGVAATVSWNSDHLEIVSNGNGAVIIDTSSTAKAILGLESGTSYSGDTPFYSDGEYLGDSNQVSVEVNAGHNVAIMGAGDQVFKESGGIDIFEVLNDLKTALQSNDSINGKYEGTDISSSIPISIDGTNNGLLLSVDGGSDTSITLSAATYNNGSSLAAGIQADLTASGVAATVNWVSGHLEIVSNGTGPSSRVTINSTSSSKTILGLASGTSYSGGAQEAIRSTVGRLDAAMNQVNVSRVQFGANSNQLDTTLGNLESYKINIEGIRSGLEDIDVAEAITQLSQQQATLEATMLSSSKIMQLSFLDFLR